MRLARARQRVAALLLAAALGRAVFAPLAGAADPIGGWDPARGEAELVSIEARWKALSAAPRRDPKGLAELDARAHELSRSASRGLGAMREAAAERDADMAALLASPGWTATEELIVKLRFRIAAIELDRALAGDPDKTRLARSAAESFSAFADAPDPALAAEARYGRGLARIALGEREAGIADLRAAAAAPSTGARARIALAEALAESGRRDEALDLATRQLAAGGLSRDLELRAKLLRLRLLVESSGKRDAAETRADARARAEVPPLAAALVAAGDPWRSSALALLAGNEDLLPAGAGADPALVRQRADALARRGDLKAALAAYRDAVAAGPPPGDPAALAGLARAAVAAESWEEARAAIAKLRDAGQPWSRDLALLELRAAYGAWQASPTPENASAVASAAEALQKTAGASPADRAEATYRLGEMARARGDLAGAIAAFGAVDQADWRVAAASAALQSRALRHARDPASEPRAALLLDLSTFIARRDLPPDARALAIALDGTLRTAHPESAPGAPAAAASPALPAAEQRAALARLREFPSAYPKSSALFPTVLRARALLEIELAGEPTPAMLDALAAEERPELAAQIASDLRQAALDDAAAKGDEAARERARRALGGAIAFAELAPPRARSAGRLELAEAALALGEPRTAERLFRAELAEKPRSLSALRGVALAASAAGDQAAARAAWERLAAQPELPAALREEAERRRRE